MNNKIIEVILFIILESGVTFLLCICFVKNVNDYSIEEALVDKLSKHYNIFQINRKNSCQKGIGDALLFFDSENSEELISESCMIVFDEGADFKIPDIKCKKIVAVVRSEDKAVISELSKFEIPVLTCGPFQKDTFTYSSVTEEKFVVSLQRAITSLSGRVIEPFEVPIEKKENESLFCVLSYAAILAQFDDYNIFN